jgi:D-alanine-D-alanine ligase
MQGKLPVLADRLAPWIPAWQGAPEALSRARVVVLHGGRSSEREVSLVSGAAIHESLARSEESGGPPLRELRSVEIDAHGAWRLEGEALSPSEALGRLPVDSVFFLGLHGGEGEDGRMQAFLEVAGRRFTGAGHAASALCMDKHLSRLTFAARGLMVPPGRKVARSEGPLDSAAIADSLAPGPWFVKPVHGGSSVGTTRVESEEELAAALVVVLELGDDALVERAVHGIEVSVGVVGNRRSGLRVLPAVEILPRRGAFFDYQEKYSESGAIELCPAEHLSPEQECEVAARAQAAYLASGCDGYARVDLIVPSQPGSLEDFDEPVILEVNTLPGFTPRSLLPREARAVGVDFRSLCLEILYLALELRGPGRS